MSSLSLCFVFSFFFPRFFVSCHLDEVKICSIIPPHLMSYSSDFFSVTSPYFFFFLQKCVSFYSFAFLVPTSPFLVFLPSFFHLPTCCFLFFLSLLFLPSPPLLYLFLFFLSFTSLSPPRCPRISLSSLFLFFPSCL